jgi:hypothetical protein
MHIIYLIIEIIGLALLHKKGDTTLKINHNAILSNISSRLRQSGWQRVNRK